MRRLLRALQTPEFDLTGVRVSDKVRVPYRGRPNNPEPRLNEIYNRSLEMKLGDRGTTTVYCCSV